MSSRALRVLEFGKALEYAAGFASTGAGREAVLALQPAPDAASVRRRLTATGEAQAFLSAREDWSFPHLPESGSAARRLAVEGSVLTAAELAELGAVLAAGRVVLRALSGETEDLPTLQELGARLLSHRELESAITRSVDAEGLVLDGASRELGRIRGRLGGAHNRVVSHLETVLNGVDGRYRVPEASVSIREGRYVIPVRREGKRVVGGYVHDESSSGATVFVEPPSAIDMMNRVRELERAEAREIQRILRVLTDRCRPLAAAFEQSMGALAEMDKRVALARTAFRWEGCVPEISDGRFEIRGGRHPLLLVGGVDAVPFDLALDPHERIVVVTGPNTGGKTVFLKSVGLISALAQSGVVPPVGPGTRLPAFDSFFADVGDEQSIADSLSTFSAHLRNLQEVLVRAGPRSLVLIDEPGAGTDPKEGEALARSVVEGLAERGCTAVITSHLGGLKRLARPGDRIVNASLHFDGEKMAPTYRFTKGRPGRSYGLAIARGLDFPAEVLDRAEAYRDRAEARLDEVLESLEAKEGKVTRLLARLDDERRRAEALQSQLEAREEELGRSEREHAERARRDARRLLLDARREVEEAIEELTGRVTAASLDEAARDARRAVERAARALEGPDRDRRRKGQRGGSRARAPDAQPAVLAPGSAVQLTDLATRGTVVAVEAGRVVVNVGGVRMRVDADRLAEVDGADDEVRGARKADARPGTPAGWSGMAPDPAAELDLRGQRADEAEHSLVRAIDEASVADLRELRVIHGKGTGALRERVTAVLDRDGRVEGFRAGKPAEGGYGVTVVRIR